MHMLRQSGVQGSELGEAVAGGAVFGDHQDRHSEADMSVCSERPPVGVVLSSKTFTIKLQDLYHYTSVLFALNHFSQNLTLA